MVSNRDTFHPYGAILKLPDGDIILAAGNNITITPAAGMLTISAIVPPSGGSTSGFVPYSGATSNVDLNNKDLTNVNNFGLNGEIDFSADGRLRGYVLSLSSTTFHGSGLNDLTFTGVYTGTGTPTYRFTITDLNTQHLSIDDASNIFVGDSISGDQSGSTGTVLSSDGSSEIVIGSITGNFSSDFSITDTTTSATANVNQVDSKVDLGTFTDGTTTLTLQAIRGRPPTLQGITYSAAASTGHTATNYWEASISQVLADGLALDFSNDAFSMGDSEQKRYGNEYLTDIHSGETRWQFRDKNDVWVNVGGDGQGHRPTFKGLGGSGSGRFVGVDNNGLTSNVASPLAIGQAVGGSSNNGFHLYSDGSGNLAQGNANQAGIQQTSGNLNIFAGGFFVEDQHGNLFYDFDLGLGAEAVRIGDLSGIASNMKLNMDLVSGDVEFSRTQNFTIIADQTFTLQNSSGDYAILGSCIPGQIAFQLGELLGSANNTFLSITDIDATMKFAASARFYAGAFNASQIYLDCDYTTSTYAIGATNFGNGTSLTIDDLHQRITATNVPAFANDAAATGAGLTTGQIYKTTTAGSTFLKIVP